MNANADDDGPHVRLIKEQEAGTEPPADGNAESRSTSPHVLVS